MEYERMREKPQGGGLSPRKLRSLLMGVEKRRSGGEQEEMVVGSEGGCGEGEACRDVDVVEVERECRVSADGGNGGEFKGAESGKGNCRNKLLEDSAMESDSGNDGTSISTAAALFEFQKGERAAQRGGLAPFSKHAPSKWDDAQKWIASPTSDRPKVGQVQGGIGGVVRKVSNFGNVNRQLSVKVALLDADQKILADEEPDTKRIDSSHNKETDERKLVTWESDSYQALDSFSKPLQMVESVGHSAINLSCHDSSMSIYGSTTFIPPPSAARSVSMRDMGTEMTPIASQEPSRTGTPVRSTTPTHSTSSRPSSPGRTLPTQPNVRSTEKQESTSGLSEKELQMKTRREIMALGTQLGKTNIAAWASKAEEDTDASTSLKIKVEEKSAKSIIDARATAWEEAEKTKYLARFKRDEIRIQAWENHQKAKAEAEMKKTEVDVERIKTLAQDRLSNKLAATSHKAEEKRAMAEAKRNRQAARAERQAEYIRRTGRTPSSFSCYHWCS